MKTEGAYYDMVQLLREMDGYVKMMEIASLAGSFDRSALAGLRELVDESFEVVKGLQEKE